MAQTLAATNAQVIGTADQSRIKGGLHLFALKLTAKRRHGHDFKLKSQLAATLAGISELVEVAFLKVIFAI
jgi:hypothetical protein